MRPFPSNEMVASLRKRFPKGTRVALIHMNDPFSRLKPGDQGTVEFVDDTGTIFCAWDNGSGLGIVLGEDAVEKL